MANPKKYIGPNRLSEIFSYIKAELDKKVTAVSGKGLSSNDYTTTEKNKLAGISSGAEVNVQSDWNENNTGSDAYILNKPTSMPASDVPSWAKQPNKPSYTFSEIASKPTTIAGYGITDAKIANGTITLGSNSITPLTQHQDISGKADKATTLAGYGITDAKIANGTITLGANTITPLTQHQSVTDNNPTLSWGTKSKVATIGSTAINVTMPSNPNTDTKVTSVGNHYAPAEDSTAQLDADASSSTAATWNSTSLVTGVTVKRDAKGHVTGLAVDSIKMPANPNTNTTYTFADGTNGFTVTPSGGTAQTVKVTPSITNNVTGSGTSGYLAKFNGANTITSGPQLGSGTTTYLRNDGSWATPNGIIKKGTNIAISTITGYEDSLNYIWYTTSNILSNQPSQYGFLLDMGMSKERHQIFMTQSNGDMYHRGGNASSDWTNIAFKTILDSSNYTTYTVKKDGTGASGTWGINVTGSAGSVAWSNVSGRPTNVSSFTNDSGYITSSGSCASATKATQDSSGNVITTTYMKIGVDYVTAGKASGTTPAAYATAEGYGNTSSGRYSHAEGYSNTVTDDAQEAHVEGWYSKVSANGAHAEGLHTTASGLAAHAEGSYFETYISGVGYQYYNLASGEGSHVEGLGTVASGIGAHAEGSAYKVSNSIIQPTSASGDGSHAEGLATTSAGNYSHSEGFLTHADGNYSHAEGDHTYASSDYQHVEGKYNVLDTNGTYAHIIGGGTDSTRKNIFTVDWNGDVCAGRSNGLTNNTKLPTGADVMSYLNSNNYRKLVWFDLQYQNVAITTRSSAGCYYAFIDNTSIDPTKYLVLSLMIYHWGGATASFTPYYQSNCISVQSDISQTVSQIYLRALCWVK